VDFGGVLTTNMWEGFDQFCRTEGLEQGMVRDLFKHEPKALADLRLTVARLEELFEISLSPPGKAV
jgi:hypothetical protein